MSSNHEYYSKIFQENQMGSKFIHWNWWAFFLGPLWLFFKGAYKASIAILCITYVITTFNLILMPSDIHSIEAGVATTSEFIYMILSILCCFFIHYYVGKYGISMYGKALKSNLENGASEGGLYEQNFFTSILRLSSFMIISLVLTSIQYSILFLCTSPDSKTEESTHSTTESQL